MGNLYTPSPDSQFSLQKPSVPGRSGWLRKGPALKEHITSTGVRHTGGNKCPGRPYKFKGCHFFLPSRDPILMNVSPTTCSRGCLRSKQDKYLLLVFQNQTGIKVPGGFQEGRTSALGALPEAVSGNAVGWLVIKGPRQGPRQLALSLC